MAGVDEELSDDYENVVKTKVLLFYTSTIYFQLAILC